MMAIGVPKPIDNRNPAVEAYLAGLEHARKAEVERIRAAILDAEPELEETVKWNAPNFRFGGEDRITFRLRPGDRVELIFHRGAKPRGDGGDLRRESPSELPLSWPAPDRAVLAFPADAENAGLERDAVAFASRWIRLGV